MQQSYLPQHQLLYNALWILVSLPSPVTRYCRKLFHTAYARTWTHVVLAGGSSYGHVTALFMCVAAQELRPWIHGREMWLSKSPVFVALEQAVAAYLA